MAIKTCLFCVWWVLYLKIIFTSVRRSHEVLDVYYEWRETPQTIIQRMLAYTLLRNDAVSQATSTEFQDEKDIFIKRDINRKRSIRCKKSTYNVRNLNIKNRLRRYGSDSSESRHTQYALPKNGNALFNPFTF